MIRTHPLIIYGKQIRRNPYFIPPQEFLAPHQAEKELQRLLNNLLHRENSSDALRQSEERFASFMRHLPGAAFIKDLDGRYVYVSETTSAAHESNGRSLGKTDKEIFGSSVSCRLHDVRKNGKSALKKCGYAGLFWRLSKPSEKENQAYPLHYFTTDGAFVATSIVVRNSSAV